MSEFQFMILSQEDMEEIEALQEQVIASLNDSSVLQPLSNEEFAAILNDKGIMLGAYKENQLVACRALLQPDVNDPEHLGIDAGAEDLSRVLYQEISFVHPQYRGFNLQKELGQRIMELVDISQFDIVCATVMPFNIPSLKDKFSQGMHVYALKYKYGGKLRYVFARHLHNPIEVEEQSITLSMNDVEYQQQLLNVGYVGVELVQKDNQWFVTYKRKKAI